MSHYVKQDKCLADFFRLTVVAFELSVLDPSRIRVLDLTCSADQESGYAVADTCV